MSSTNLVVLGQGQNINQLLEERLQRCDLKLNQIIALDKKKQISQIDLRNLKSIFLTDNELFNELVGEIKNWNEAVKTHYKTRKEIEHGVFYNNLYRLLANNLREVVNTTNHQVRDYFLGQIKKWFENQRSQQDNGRPGTAQQRPGSSSNRPGTRGSQFQGGDSVMQQGVTDFDKGSMTIQDYLNPNDANIQDYQNKNRSKHDELNPPEDRLKEFKRHMIAFESTPTTRPGTSSHQFKDTTQSQQWRGSDIGRPLTTQTNTINERPGTTGSNDGRANTYNFRDTVNIGDKPSLRKPADNNMAWNYTGGFATLGVTGVLGPKELPKLEKVEKDEDEEGEEGEGTEQLQQESQSKLELVANRPYVDHITPHHFISEAQQNQLRKYNENRGIFLHYNPTNDPAEMRMEEYWFKNRNKQLQEKRETEEIQQIMQEWSCSKGRMEEEITKKAEVQKYGSMFDSIGHRLQSKVGSQEIIAESKDFEEQDVDEDQKQFEADYKNYIQLKNQPDHQKILKSKQVHIEEDAVEEEVPKNQMTIESAALKVQPSFLKMQTSVIENPQDVRKSVLMPRGSINDQLPEIVLPPKKQLKFEDFSNEKPLTRKTEIFTDPAEKFSQVERSIKLDRIQRIRQLRGNIINATSSMPQKTEEDIDDEEIKIRKNNSLSIYCRNQSETQLNYKPFSNMYRKINSTTLRKQQLDEIAQIKDNFSRNNVKCSMDNLMQSLITPEGLPQSKLLSLPICGSRMPLPPAKGGKKKKGKKKKK